MTFLSGARGMKLAFALMAALSMAACSKSPNSLNGGVAGASAAAPGSQQDFAVNVGDRVFFDTDSTELSPTAQATLDKQARFLARYPRYVVTIQGNADERGTRAYNFALGARRAAVTKDYLVARGIAASRIKTISFGKERPVATCDNESCWSQNRRAVTVLDNASF